MLGNILFQPFLEYFLDKAIDDFITDPKQGLINLEKVSQDFKQFNLKEIILELKNNPVLLIHLQKILSKTKRTIIRRFIINILQTLNKGKGKVLHFDFRKSLSLTVSKIKNLLASTENLVYACFILKNYPELEALVKLLQKESDTLFFIFLEPKELTIDLTKFISEAENIALLLQADNLISLQEASTMLSNYSCLYGAYVFLNNDNFEEFLNHKYLENLKTTEIAFLIYIRAVKLNQAINSNYLNFLKEYHLRLFPILDFHKDQKFLIDTYLK